jgi:hypothetical protein
MGEEQQLSISDETLNTMRAQTTEAFEQAVERAMAKMFNEDNGDSVQVTDPALNVRFCYYL